MNQVVIIGGGIAGMYTADRLLEKGIKPVLFESSYRLGGHIETRYEKGYQMEMCAGRFNKYHQKLLTLLHKYNLHIAPNEEKKEFHPILYSGKSAKDISGELLEKVFSYSKKLSEHFLKQKTFGELCELVLGPVKTKVLIDSFGYNAEFLIANAYTSLKIFEKDFNLDVTYYHCHEGLSELIKRMEEDLIQRGCIIHTNHYIKDFRWNKDHFEIDVYDIQKDKIKIVSSKQIVLAVPKETLLKFSFFTKKQKILFDTVQGVNLHRIYMKYDSTWFRDISRTTTDLPIRQFIPVDREKGLAMVSYSDLNDADYWEKYANMGEEKLQQQIQEQLHQLFPEKKIPLAEKVYSFFWKNAVHVWKPKVDPYIVRSELQEIHPRLFIVGESFSLNQGWMEGALDTVDEVIQKMEQSGGIDDYKAWILSLGTITQKDLELARKKYPHFKWLILQIPGESIKSVIDVTQWDSIHPGGPYEKLLYTDVTTIFHTKSVHFKEENMLRDEVKEKLKQYRIGYLNE